MEESLVQLINAANENIGVYGWLGGVAALLSGGVGVFRVLFPDQWERLPSWTKPLIITLAVGGGAAILSALGGMAIPSALVAGLLTGLSAIGIHQNVKAAKEVAEKVNPSEP